MPINLLFTNPPIFIAWIAAIVIAITVHEFSHVLAAYLQGDSTGKDMGRLTLNPVAHIDPWGMLLLVVVGFGWGNPAPYNPFRLRWPRIGSAIVALAGPFANLVAIVVFALIFRLLLPVLNLPPQNLLTIFLVFLVQVNIVLMVFNLIPIPPLDGARILLHVLPDRFDALKEGLERYGPFLLILLVLAGGGLFARLFSFVTVLVSRLLG